MSARVAAIRAAAKASYGEAGEPIIRMASSIALAWMEQLCADADAWAATGDERRRRIAQAARVMAGEYANDIVSDCPGQAPMIHRLHHVNKEVTCISAMLGGCVPLWLIYYRIIENMIGAVEYLLPKEEMK